MIKAEYIWIDGTEPTPQLRSKTKILNEGELLPVWGFDGSSTNQAEGHNSDCVLNPVFICHDPIRRGNNKLVLCEVLNTDMTSHKTNTRSALQKIYEEYEHTDMWFGMEQEYTLMNMSNTKEPYGFSHCPRTERVYTWESGGLGGRNISANLLPQGPYYCSVGAGLSIGRDIAEDHLDVCLEAGIDISGINAEVMPGQWEFQVGPVNAMEVSDQLWIARWLLHRIAEKHSVAVSFDPKPAKGDWNGAGCHTNFSSKAMREPGGAYHYVQAAEALGERSQLHIKNYGAGIEKRLTGDHETCSYKEYRYGISDRGASVRVPWQVAKDGKGYIEDRRPNANCDPYVVTRLITETVCGAPGGPSMGFQESKNV